MKKIIVCLTLCLAAHSNGQEKNFIDKPFMEVTGSADTLVVPNQIFIEVLLSESDTRGKESVEDLEQKMLIVLRKIGIDTQKKVAVIDLMSNYKKYFLKEKDVLKTKSYAIEVHDANSAFNVFLALEEINISNVSIDRISHSEASKIQLKINANAMKNALEIAQSYTQPLHQKIGPALFIGNYNSVIQSLSGRISGVKIRGNVSLNEYEKAYTEPIQFEKIKISSSIAVKFALE